MVRQFAYVAYLAVLAQAIAMVSAANNSNNTSTGDDGGCFPKHARVQLTDLSFVKVSDLKPGDYVRTYDHSSKQIVESRFIDYLHYDKLAVFKFISIKTAASLMPSLEISEYHLIQRLKRDSNDQHEFVFAKDLIVGDKVFLLAADSNGVESMKYVEISGLDEIYEQGAYAPLTDHGTLIVNNVLTSCYANSYSHELSQFGFAPYRLWTRLMQPAQKEAQTDDLYWNPFASFYMLVSQSKPFSYLVEY